MPQMFPMNWNFMFFSIWLSLFLILMFFYFNMKFNSTKMFKMKKMNLLNSYKFKW